MLGWFPLFVPDSLRNTPAFRRFGRFFGGSIREIAIYDSTIRRFLKNIKAFD
jgi:hypothetical protein